MKNTKIYNHIEMKFSEISTNQICDENRKNYIDWEKLNVSIDWSKEISLSRLHPLYKSLSEKYRLVKKDGYPNMVMKSYSKDYADNLLRALNFLKNRVKNLK